MKSLKFLLVLPLALAAVWLVTQGPDQERWRQAWLALTQTGQGGDSPEPAHEHHEPGYVCPMHPQILRDAPGTCPICGMSLVPRRPLEPAPTTAGERKILFYRHPHKPDVVSDHPLKDEMGMDYVPVYDAGPGGGVLISPTVMNNLGLRSAAVEKGRLWRRIDTLGYVEYDSFTLGHVHVRTEGWVERLYVRSLGQRVKRGERLFDLYSPTLVRAQEEYLQARAGGNERLIAASSERLAALGVSREQIEALSRRGTASQTVGFFAHRDGVVTILNATEGMYLELGTEAVAIADLSEVWIIAEVFEHQAAWVKPGQSGEVRLASLPGRLWEGKVEYVYPNLEPQTRTLRVRLRFPNPGEVLKPNMFADVTIFAGPKDEVLSIPREALIRTGQEQRVILDLGGGRFAQRPVVSGMESGERVEILSGLKPGEKVVLSGQFLIDSEASLKASLKRLETQAPHEDHSGHEGHKP